MKRLALTINHKNDGFPTTKLNEMAELLYRLDFSATFFLTNAGLSQFVSHETWHSFMVGGHEIGYHTRLHPSKAVMDIQRGINWESDYLSWRKYAFDIGGSDLMSLIRPYARAPWGNFTPAFREMCECRNLNQIGWSVDVNDLKHGQKLVHGHIMMLEARRSEYRWLPYLRDNFDGEVVSLRGHQMIELEEKDIGRRRKQELFREPA